MKEKPVLSINITEKTYCLCMLAAQQLLDTINSKKSFRAIVERSPEAEKITIKIYTKDIPVEEEGRRWKDADRKTNGKNCYDKAIYQ